MSNEPEYTGDRIMDYLDWREAHWRPQFWYKYLLLKPDDGFVPVVVDWTHLPPRFGMRGEYSLYGYYFHRTRQRYEHLWYDAFSTKEEAYSAAFEAPEELGHVMSRDDAGEYVQVISIAGSERVSKDVERVDVDWQYPDN